MKEMRLRERVVKAGVGARGGMNADGAWDTVAETEAKLVVVVEAVDGRWTASCTCDLTLRRRERAELRERRGLFPVSGTSSSSSSSSSSNTEREGDTEADGGSVCGRWPRPRSVRPTESKEAETRCVNSSRENTGLFAAAAGMAQTQTQT